MSKPWSPYGLSPRVRGNQIEQFSDNPIVRSIPAGAGEPSRCDGRDKQRQVYPRGCGGTLEAGVLPRCVAGLSPRVRGNHAGVSNSVGIERSIPAGAGEPSRTSRSPTPRTVYPRGCGGTAQPIAIIGGVTGLSPRVRGNQLGIPCVCGLYRSIPAGAGEPLNTKTYRQAQRVYPRGCGGTSLLFVYGLLRRGLSPRVRGNPQLA